ncbi:hypothetical protein [Mycetocola sp. JXN-3]|uniref:hypothetical protein n=1 Tax=Mycetocola sp. JXN-3 TaxID=2116510 RepID=UPI00165D1673|nr:hypothetical protein [Mycetocola sp. JXN-3]
MSKSVGTQRVHGRVHPQRLWLRRSLGLTAVIAATALTTACFATPTKVDATSRVLNAVNVSLASDGAVTAVKHTTISVDDAAGTTSSDSRDLAPSDVVNDLPVRITTQYTTEKKTGTNLADLKGYTGRVAINVTVENLTVGPQNITFDAAGQARTEPALVGAPLTIAASSVLSDVAPSDVVVDQNTGTNGVIGTDGTGKTVIQWASLLAPPLSGASKTLRLVANVSDFTVPSIDLAVQPGLSTDLSLDGVLNSAFSSGATSELALQRRTIGLVSEVTDVLAKAGTTITEVNTNLTATATTLGTRTAEQLRESSANLAQTLSGLSDQLGSLKTDLDSTVTGTAQTTTQQLAQTVNSMETMLGDTSSAPPSPILTGTGCSVVVAPPGEASNVYSSLALISAQLDGYASASASCRDEVATELQRSIGPATPSVETCSVDAPSMTCALFAASVTVTGSLIDLVRQGDGLIAELQPEILAGARQHQNAVTTGLANLLVQVDALTGTTNSEAVADALSTLETSVNDTKTALDSVSTGIADVHNLANQARNEIGSETQAGSMLRQTSELSAALCTLITNDSLPRDQVEELRAYLTVDACPDPTATDPLPPLTPPAGYSGALATRLLEQNDTWTQVSDLTDATTTDSGLGKALSATRARLTEVLDHVAAVKTALNSGNGSLGGAVSALRDSLTETSDTNNQLTTSLSELETQQSELAEKIKNAFEGAANDTSDRVDELINNQVRVIHDQGKQGIEGIVAAFNRSVVGLDTTADSVAKNARTTVDKQRAQLSQQSEALVGALSAQTAASLETIARSTGASTRDVEGAATLLGADLNKVMLDLGDRQVNGSGLLGSMSTSAAKAGTADYQLALATQNAQGYANIRSEDVAGILLRQAQFKASIAATAKLPVLGDKVPAGASSQSLYGFRIEAAK